MKILLTGGAGFIGSAVIRHLIRETDLSVVNVDKLTYAATPEALEEAADSPRYALVQADIADPSAMQEAFARHDPDAVMHLAAESHVDRSIDGPAEFIRTNVLGTFTLLEAARDHWNRLPGARKDAFRFHHISTDEVFGTLTPDEPAFEETTPYRPNSPESASKAGSDHLERAGHETYGLPVVAPHSSNNYGPWQFPEKLIPVMAIAAAEGRPLPVYGRGENIRDWLHVEDHARALVLVLEKGRLGETYNIGGNAERMNMDVVKTICAFMDRENPGAAPHERLIDYVADRPGHDLRYAINAGKIRRDLGWSPRETFETGMESTLRWFMDHKPWWQAIRARQYDGRRLGTG